MLRRRQLRPVPVYLLLSGGYTFLHTMVITVNLVYQVQEANLTALQLVLVGTALEATVFLCEVPTGVIADIVSRRLSILIGLVLVGAGLALMGAFARFDTILIAQIVWGAGFTFISGARQAWIADEVGADNAGPVYLRSAQVEQLARIAAIPLSTAIATIQLNLPMLIGGAAFLPLALLRRGSYSRPGCFHLDAERRQPAGEDLTAAAHGTRHRFFLRSIERGF
jgi:DHA3 family tetracycline resistance protein-like MFS transporter